MVSREQRLLVCLRTPWHVGKFSGILIVVMETFAGVLWMENELISLCWLWVMKNYDNFENMWSSFPSVSRWITEKWAMVCLQLKASSWSNYDLNVVSVETPPLVLYFMLQFLLYLSGEAINTPDRHSVRKDKQSQQELLNSRIQ